MCDHSPEATEKSEGVTSAEVVATLVENKRMFLTFIQRRVDNRDVAEEILQSALAKNIGNFDTVRESAVAWFYQVLRNAIIDYRRRKTVADKRFANIVAHAAASEAGDDEELRAVVCKCVNDLASTLKPEYADALRQIEIEGESVKDYANRLGISSNNAGVRVFRAREALRKQVLRSCGTCAAHGCLDCTCEHAHCCE